MACDSRRSKLDAYLDAELPADEMREFDAHVRNCASCASDALARVQMKRSVRAAGLRYAPTAKFRQDMEQQMQSRKSAPTGRMGVFAWALATAAVALVAGLGAHHLGRQESGAAQIYTEVADLHVAALAGTSPVDVISTDRHTVKPWFQGKIPFAFELPELQNSEFMLLGGRVTYLGQAPGAHLIYQVRKHEISVLIFRNTSMPDGLRAAPEVTGQTSFNLETWSQGGLRYFVVGDANAADVGALSRLFRAAGVS